MMRQGWKQGRRALWLAVPFVLFACTVVPHSRRDYQKDWTIMVYMVAATDNHMSFSWYDAGNWWSGDGSWWANTYHTTTWYRVKVQVDKDNPCIIGRGEIPSEGGGGHARLALGYKANDIYHTVNDYGYKTVGYRKVHFLWWSWWAAIRKWTVVGHHSAFLRTDRYMLISDGNGYERDNSHSVNYNKPKIGNYSKELFWENAKNNGYSFYSLVWKN